MEQVRLGIIGVGNMGSGHTANIMAGKVPVLFPHMLSPNPVKIFLNQV